MYLVCLSGTLAVFYQEFERWEQPGVNETPDFDPVKVENAYHAMLERVGDQLTEHTYISLPTRAIPRTSVSTEEQGWFVRTDGSLGEAVNHEWTHLLLNLHLYLHLPESFGMIIVSALGAMLCALIISGFLCHARILRDAFSLRLGGSRQLEQTDIHNRLSVWGAPFHLMIAITGAYFGLVLLIMALIASANYEGNRSKIIHMVFGEEPTINTNTEHLAIASALEQVSTLDPGARPLFLTVHESGTPRQFMEVATLQDGRLVYSENYRFDPEGNYLGKVGFSDGEVGKQVVYSVYRLHFGHFGGFPVKILYGVLGLALTIVSVTGVNIWLAKRKTRDYLNYLWSGLVWGTPAALTLSALSQVAQAYTSVGLFWLAIFLSTILSLMLRDPERGRRLLQILGSGLLAVLVLAHTIRFGNASFAPAAIGINLSLCLTALTLGSLAYRPRIPTAQNQTIQ